MAGIYLHIPFCFKACHYCNFHFSTSLKNKTKMVSSIVKEIELRKNYLKNETLKTIYFGGGTPSLLSKNEIDLILNKINSCFKIAELPEITFECNPDDLTKEKLNELRKSGINRLSIGIQSFNHHHLVMMNRSHNEIQATKSILSAQDAGFENITIDLMYGLPDLDAITWKENLKKAIELNVPHISAYNLTIEERTALAHQVKSNQVKIPDEQEVIQQFKIMINMLGNSKYEHYEISNFAKNGFISKHNSAYWLGNNYLGIGPSAHSYDGNSRTWNIKNNSSYIKSIENERPFQEAEKINPRTAYNEYILTRLRTKWGIEKQKVKEIFGEEIINHLNKMISPFIKNEEIVIKNNKYLISSKGKMRIDYITSELFIV